MAASQAEGSLQLAFTRPRDELAFHIYNGKATAHTSRWQRLLCGTVWSLHCFKLLILALHMTQARPRLYLMLAFALPMACFEYGVALRSVLSPSWSVLYHEHVKVALQLCNCATVLVSLILSAGREGAAKSPLEIMLGLAGVQVFGQMRLSTAVNVYPVLASVFVFMEASQWLFAAAPRSLRLELARGCVYLALGVALPLFMSCVLEARSRHSFLVRHRQPLSKLGPFWSRVHRTVFALDTRCTKRAEMLGALGVLRLLFFRLIGENPYASVKQQPAGYQGTARGPQHAQQAQSVHSNPSRPASQVAHASMPVPVMSPSSLTGNATNALTTPRRAEPATTQHTDASRRSMQGPPRHRIMVRRSISSRVIHTPAAADLLSCTPLVTPLTPSPFQGMLQPALSPANATRAPARISGNTPWAGFPTTAATAVADAHTAPLLQLPRKRSRSAEYLRDCLIGMPVELWRVSQCGARDDGWLVQRSTQSMHSAQGASASTPASNQAAEQLGSVRAFSADNLDRPSVQESHKHHSGDAQAASMQDTGTGLDACSAEPTTACSQCGGPVPATANAAPTTAGQHAQHGANRDQDDVCRPSPCGGAPVGGQAQHAERSGGDDHQSSGHSRIRSERSHSTRTIYEDDGAVHYNAILAGVGACLSLILVMAAVEKFAPTTYSQLCASASRLLFGL